MLIALILQLRYLLLILQSLGLSFVCRSFPCTIFLYSQLHTRQCLISFKRKLHSQISWYWPLPKQPTIPTPDNLNNLYSFIRKHKVCHTSVLVIRQLWKKQNFASIPTNHMISVCACDCVFLSWQSPYVSTLRRSYHWVSQKFLPVSHTRRRTGLSIAVRTPIDTINSLTSYSHRNHHSYMPKTSHYPKHELFEVGTKVYIQYQNVLTTMALNKIMSTQTLKDIIAHTLTICNA